MIVPLPAVNGSTDFLHRFRLKYPTERLSYLTASLPGYPVSITVVNAIKNRASNEEILTILKEVPNPNQDDDDGEPLILFCFSFYFVY